MTISDAAVAGWAVTLVSAAGVAGRAAWNAIMRIIGRLETKIDECEEDRETLHAQSSALKDEIGKLREYLGRWMACTAGNCPARRLDPKRLP